MNNNSQQQQVYHNQQARSNPNSSKDLVVDYPIWRLYSTTNTFTISPATLQTHQKSLIIDKKTIKMKEHDIVVRDEAQWVIEIQGLLGILNILGVEHLMVIMGKGEVASIPHKLSPPNNPAFIYELQEIELIPFQIIDNNPILEYQMKSLREGIKKYMECGYYISYSFDLTSNAQRREKLLKPSESQDLTTVDPLQSLDSRYMWNYNLYKQLRAQHIPSCWMITLIQGYVGHAKQGDIELILISRRRWQMGGTRYNARGIDEDGNAGNAVETEQIVLKHVKKDTYVRLLTYSFSQVRGSLPFYWNQEGGKVKIDRSLESSADGFIKHCNTLMSDYDSDSFLLVNLLNQQLPHEEMLTQGLRKLLDETAMYFQKRNKRIDYDYFDFHFNYKKGGIALLDTYINDMLRNLYLRDIGMYQEKFSIYMVNGSVSKKSRKILAKQKGVVRTNCLDCLDRTNVFQAKICVKVFEDLLRTEFSNDPSLVKLMLQMWTISGDFISKIYAGTQTMLQTLATSGKQTFFNKLDQGFTSVMRFLRQNLSDEFKQECILLLSGQHPLCSPTPSNYVQSFIIREIDRFSENQKIILHMATLNCAGKQPDSYKELIPIFQPVTDGVQPDIIVIGLQEIVKLNAVSIFKGKNRTKINEWEQLLRSALEASLPSRPQSLEDRYVWVIAKSMVGCFIGLFVKQKLLSRLKDLKTTKIKTGLGGSSGNKGSVIVRFNLDDTAIMLMNCHLMSGKNKGNKRTDELNFIFDNAFKNEGKNRKWCIENHDMVFILGDLNYRIAMPNEFVRSALQKQDIKALKDHDELIQAFKMYSGTSEMQYQFYREFTEGEINFQPTYKYDRKSQKYDTSKKQRVPSWCDRILWKKNTKVKQTSLRCLQNIIFSDHRPVVSQFEIVSIRIDEYKTGKMVEKFFENMRFQSQHALGKGQQQNNQREEGSFTIPIEEVVESVGYQLQKEDESLGGLSSQEKTSESENSIQPSDPSANSAYSLMPMIDEGDEDEEEKLGGGGLGCNTTNTGNESSSLQQQIENSSERSRLEEDSSLSENSLSPSKLQEQVSGSLDQQRQNQQSTILKK